MTILTPIIVSTIEDIKVVAQAEFAAKGITLEDVIDAMENLYNSNYAQDEAALTVDNAVDEEGNFYKNIYLVATTRFIKNGIRYIGNGELTINFDAIIDMLKLLAK